MELTAKDLENIREAVKQGTLEAMYAYEEFKKESKSKKSSDLISTTKAYKLIGRARVEELIARGLLQRVSSGRAKNSARYVSKKKLLELNNTYLQ